MNQMKKCWGTIDLSQICTPTNSDRVVKVL